MQELRARSAAAYHNQQDILSHFYACVSARREEMSEGETNIYFVYDENSDAFKIGVGDNVMLRLAGLQVGNPNELILYAAAPGTRPLESLIHGILLRSQIRGEWFMATEEVLAMADVFVGAWQICSDIEAAGDVPVAEDTIYFLIDGLENAKAA